MRRTLQLVVAVTLVLSIPRSASAREPEVTAWWSAANQGTVATTAPPDVSGDELLIEGAQPDSLAGTLPQHSAVAAVSFALTAREEVRSLRLEVDSASPNASVRACRATTAFSATSNGAWSDVPSYDCEDAVDATVEDGALDFGEVDALRGPTELRLLLLPASPGRVVIRAGGADALRSSSPRRSSKDEGARVGLRTVTRVPNDVSVPRALGYESQPTRDPRIETGTAELPFGGGTSAFSPVESHAPRSDRTTRAVAAVVLLVLLAPFALRQLGPRRQPVG